MVPVLLTQFLAVQRHGSLGRAAAALGLSQPALSKAMRRLEAELGATLLERGPGGVAVTEAGRALAARAAAALAELERAREEVQRLGEAGLLRLGAGPAVAALMLPRALAALRREQPGARWMVREALSPALAEAVASGALDLAVCNRPWGGVPPGLQAQRLAADEFVVAAGAAHALHRRRAVPPAALLDHPWALPPRGGTLWPRLVELFLRAGLSPPEPAVETESLALLRGMLLADGGYLSVLPRRVLGGPIRALPVAGFAVPRELVVLTRDRAAMPALAARLVALLAAAER